MRRLGDGGTALLPHVELLDLETKVGCVNEINQPYRASVHVPRLHLTRIDNHTTPHHSTRPGSWDTRQPSGRQAGCERELALEPERRRRGALGGGSELEGHLDAGGGAADRV